MSYAWQINQDDTHSVGIVTYSGNVISKTLAEVKQLVSDAGFNCAILTATNYYQSTNSYMIFTNFGNVDSDLYLASNTYLSDSEDEKIGYSFPNTTGFNQYQCFVLANDGESLRQVTGTVFNNFSSPVVVNNITYQRINHQEQMSTIPPIFITTYTGNIYIDGELPQTTNWQNVDFGISFQGEALSDYFWENSILLREGDAQAKEDFARYADATWVDSYDIASDVILFSKNGYTIETSNNTSTFPDRGCTLYFKHDGAISFIIQGGGNGRYRGEYSLFIGINEDEQKGAVQLSNISIGNYYLTNGYDATTPDRSAVYQWIKGATEIVPSVGAGGGATHIATRTGQLEDLSSHLSDILIVAGGGGGGVVFGSEVHNGENAGGMAGAGNLSGTQSTGYAFGEGESSAVVGNGGGGLYGGYAGKENLSGIYAPSKLGNYQLAVPLDPETLYNGNNIINYATGSFDSYFDTYGDYLPNVTTVLMDNEYMTLTCTIVANDYHRIDVLVKANSQTYQLIETQSHTARDQIPAGVYFIVNENTHSIRCGTVMDDGWYLRLRQSSVYNYSALYNAIVNSIPVVMYSAGAGSGYIGNPLLSNKKMYGNNIPSSSATDTYTKSTSNVSATPREKWSKMGNGFARITYLRPLSPTPPTPAADFFRPNFSSDGRDTIRYDAESLVIYDEGPGGSPFGEYGTGTCVDSHADTPTFSNNSVIIAEEAYGYNIYWAYSDTYAQQKAVNPNGVIKIGMTATTSNAAISVTLYTTPDYYAIANGIWSFYFNDPNGNTNYTYCATDNDNSFDKYDDKALPTVLNNDSLEYYIYLNNGIISKIEYYVNNVLYNTFDNLSSYNVSGFNTTLQGDQHSYNEFILDLSNTNYDDELDATISDLHISYT